MTSESLKIRRLMNDLVDAFIWSETPQNAAYWADVHMNLGIVLDQIEKSPAPGSGTGLSTEVE